MLKKIVSETCT